LPSEAAVTLPEAGFPRFMNKEKNDEVRLRFRMPDRTKSRQKAPVGLVFVKMKYNESQGADNRNNAG
jgi:hypothetical protein